MWLQNKLAGGGAAQYLKLKITFMFHQIKETLKRKETTFNTSRQLLALLAC